MIRALVLIISILIALSCDTSKNDFDGHWHLVDKSQNELIFLDSLIIPVEIFTMDINGIHGESNSNSLFQVKGDITINKKHNQIKIISDCHLPIVYDYTINQDTLILSNERWNQKYHAYKVDINCCNYRQNHNLDGTRTNRELYLPFLFDSTLVTKDLDWRNSNNIIFEYHSRQSLYGQRIFGVTCDNSFVAVEEIDAWYNEYVVKTFNKVRVFSDVRQSLIDIKRLIVKLEEIPCDSIFFAAIDNNYFGDLENVKWIDLKELSRLISDEDRIMLDSYNIEYNYGKKSEDWFYEIITTANKM